MFFHPRILFHTLVYSASMIAIIARDEPSYSFLSFLAIVLFVNVLAMRRAIYGGRAFALLLPSLFSFFSAITLWFADEPIRAEIFCVLSVLLFYFSILGGYRLSRNPRDLPANGFLAAALVATIFLFFSMLVGFYLNFAIDSWMFAPVYFLVVYLLSLEYLLSIDDHTRRNASRSAALLGIFSAELFWISGFWPFGYLTTGVIMLIFYYVLWDMLQAHILNLLTKRRVIADMAIFIILTVIILITTRWTAIF